ncbi:MAG: cytochrome c [Verrucomicrobiota bacterium]|nr:cytochrome c [Verrucomicrobiota bacterium]
MTNQHSKTNLRLALTLSAGLALTAILSGCGQSSGASQSSSASDPAAEQTPPVEQTAAAPAAPAAPSAEHGQQLFTATCSGCHGPQGAGIPHLGKDLQTSKFVAGLSDDQLVDFITQGRAANDPLNTTHVAMPPKGGNPALSAQDLRDIVAYLRQLQQQAGTNK